MIDDRNLVLRPHEKGSAPGSGVRIYYETFGNPGDPVALLITGMDDQCTSWAPYFIQPIVEAGYRVVRFDNRDCGLSAWMDNWEDKDPYTLEDMALDALGVLDTLGIERAHLIGASMGGMIAQRIAVRFPARTLSLISIASSGFALDPDPELQPAHNAEKVAKACESLRARYPNYLYDPGETVEYRLEAMKLFQGSRFPFEERRQRRVQEENVLERKGFNPMANLRQLAAVLASGSILEELGKITVPTLVLHGTEDPLIPASHAEKYAALIPNARLVWMEGVGHELPEGVMGQVHAEILDTTGR